MRQRSSRITGRFGLGLLVPYVVLACFGQFLHTHGWHDDTEAAVAGCRQALSAVQHHGGLPSGEARAAAADQGGPCAICAWVAGTHSQPVVHDDDALTMPHMTPADEPVLILRPTPSHTPPSVRAPPQA
jgi:hypothetical protein